MPLDLPVMPDATFYINRLQRKVPGEVLHFVDSRGLLHSGIACGEMSITVGALDPNHPKTKESSAPIMRLLETIEVAQSVSPSSTAWAEAGMIAGMLARTQLLGRSKKEMPPVEYCCERGRRRELLHDVLLYLTALENDAILVTANAKDIDLVRRIKPGAHVLFYRPLEKAAAV
jgi:hypothetical protein